MLLFWPFAVIRQLCILLILTHWVWRWFLVIFAWWRFSYAIFLTSGVMLAVGKVFVLAGCFVTRWFGVRWWFLWWHEMGLFWGLWWLINWVFIKVKDFISFVVLSTDSCHHYVHTVLLLSPSLTPLSSPYSPPPYLKTPSASYTPLRVPQCFSQSPSFPPDAWPQWTFCVFPYPNRNPC